MGQFQAIARGRCGALLLGLLLLALFVPTLLPGTGYSGDTAKFQFVGRVLGTPHGPGYPTYVLLDAAWVRLFPWGTLAWRVNLLSALLAIGAALYLRALLALLGASPWPALLGAACIACTRTLWSQALVAEVYTLQALYIAGLSYHLCAWRQNERRGHLWFGLFLFAWAFGNHLGIAACVPAVLWCVGRGLCTWSSGLRVAAGAVGLLLLSALQYLYLVQRSFDPATPYLEMRALNLERFLWFLSGSKFQAQLFSMPLERVFSERLPELLRFAGAELLALWLFVPLGVLQLWRTASTRAALGLLLGCALGTLVLASGVDTVDWWVHLIPTWMLLGCIAGCGLARLWDGAWGPAVARALLRTLLALLPLGFVVWNWSKVDRSSDERDAQRALAWIELAERDSILIAPDYNQAEYLWYFLLGEGLGERNLHVLATRNLQQVREYLVAGQALTIPETRRTLPAGLDVLAIGERDRLALERAGLSSRPLGQSMFLIGPPGSESAPRHSRSQP